jgi:hypothetical protein
MRIKPTRPVVATSLAALVIAGLAGCGSSGGSQAVAAPAQPDTNSSSAPAATPAATDAAAASSNGSTGNPFVDIRTAAQHMPGSADVLAGGFVKALKLSGNADSKASNLQSSLTYLFTEHVYLAGIAVATAYDKGATSDAFNAAKASVLANATDIETAVTGIVGATQGAAFKAAFDAHIGDFVSYAVAAKGKDTAGMAKAVTSLTAYAKTVGTFFNKVTGGVLSASAVQADTMTHILTLKAAVDDLAAGKTTAYADLKKAADHMEMSAQVLSKGIAKATKMSGDTTDKAAGLRDDLTSKLVGHVYLAGVAVFTAYTDPKSTNSDAFKAAAAAVQANSTEIGKIVGAAGAKAQQTFQQVWDQHVTDFVSYAVADATNDAAAKAKAVTALTGYESASGQFFDTITAGALPAAAVQADLATHVTTLEAAIDSLAKALLPSTG